MKHKANSMKKSTSKPNEVWYIDSGASNHMMSHEEWFSYLKKPEQPGFVETGDDTHIRSNMSVKSPLVMSDRRGDLWMYYTSRRS